jgi:hypothetical protein
MARRPARLLLGAVTIATSFAVAGVAQAQPINVSTGVNAAGTPLADGSSDPFWTISVQGGPSTPAIVLFPAGQCCGMETANTSVAKWISDVTGPTSPATGWGVGPTAVLQRTFDLTGYSLPTVSFTGNWRAADNLIGLLLNGNLIASTGGAFTSNWDTDHPFSVTTGFLPGLNTIEVQANSVNSLWDGLYLAGTVSGQVVGTVPEPATVALMATGLLALAGVMRRRVHR